MNVLDHDLLSDTPFVAVDLNTLEKNIAHIAHLAKASNVKLRPHTKTHKSPWIAQKQISAGASGITCAKLGEAEVMVDNGIDDILIAFPLVGKKKLERFGNLLQRTKLTVALDDLIVAKGINDVGAYYRKKIPVYVDVDTGLHRMGRSPRESIGHIVEINKLPYIEVIGVMSHTGQAYAENSNDDIKAVAIQDAEMMFETKEGLEKYGVFLREISIGATATARFIQEIPHVTEMRPGMYVFNDRFVMGAGGAREEDCAVRVIATVVARPAKDRIIIDAGSKTLAQDPYKYGGHGFICGYPNMVIKSLSEEHGTLWTNEACDLSIGDVIEIIPNHVCPVINLADQLFGFRNGELEYVIPVLGRGRNR